VAPSGERKSTDLVITGGISCKLENFGGEVLKNCGEVD
jgi:hypothetical protein